MDRDEALKLLRGGPEGIAEWNQRRTTGEMIPDLSGAILNGTNLSEANLNGITLTGANLNGAILRATYLRAPASTAPTSAGLSSTGLTSAWRIFAALRSSWLISTGQT